MGQSVLTKHCTHCPFPVLHFGAEAEQLRSAVHLVALQLFPVIHVSPAGQSVLLKHSTQIPVVVLQTDANPEQFAFDVHLLLEELLGAVNSKITIIITITTTTKIIAKMIGRALITLPFTSTRACGR